MGFLHFKPGNTGWLKSLGFVVIVLLAFVDGMLYQAHRTEAPALRAEESFGSESFEMQAQSPQNPDQNAMSSTEDAAPPEASETPEVLAYEPPFSIQAPLGWIEPWTNYALQTTIIMAESALNQEESLPANRFVAKMQDFMNWIRSKNIQDPKMIAIRGLKEFYQRNQVQEWEKLDQASFEALFLRGSYVILPVLASELQNPYYIGTESKSAHYLFAYRYENGEVIVHDPGTSRGKANRYPLETLYQAYTKSPESFAIEIFQKES